MTWLIAAVGIAACRSDAQPTSDGSASASSSADPSPSAFATASKSDKLTWKRCKRSIAKAERQPPLAGAPKFEERRIMLARVRGKALLWKREPARSSTLDRILSRNRSASDIVSGVRHVVRDVRDRAERRAKLLREGYLFAVDERLALALQQQVALTDLFDEPTAYLQRGSEIFELSLKPRSKKHHKRYVYTSGRYANERAEVLLGDRVATRKEDLQSPSLVLDLEELMARERFDRIKPKHLSKRHLVADVRYGPGVWVRALFDSDETTLQLRCELLNEARYLKKQRFIQETDVLRRAMRRVRAVVRSMVREEMPFDADPNQSNGYLRKAWQRAYFKGWKAFEYEDKRYFVYTDSGQPRPPQVCIDFLTDTWERASGTWFNGATDEPKPKRTSGAIDFDKLEIENRRSVAEFTKFASDQPEHFEVWEIPKNERISFRQRAKFFSYLSENADQIRPGDMLTIHGYKDRGRPHYHSIIVLEQDPISGIPTLVAGNAVVPREQTLEGVMQISPKRSLRHRIRIRGEWLKQVAAQADAEPDTAPDAQP